MCDDDNKQKDLLLLPDDIERLLLAGKTSVPPKQVRTDIKQRILHRIRCGIDSVAPPKRLSHCGAWINFSSKIKIRILHFDATHNTQNTLWHCRPGASIPAHSHPVSEELLILEGSLLCEEQRMTSGDFSYMPAGSSHGKSFTDTGCLIYLRGMPIQL